jgi:signal transduction histidine kinase/ActR/RegA family two-component response regulator
VTLGTRALRDLLHRIADPDQRADAARALAQALGAQGLLLYVRDAALDVMLPAPGMPKTVVGGPAWRTFLRRCLDEAEPAARVDLHPWGEIEARALTRDGTALVLLGEASPSELLHEVQDAFPLLAALLIAQQNLQIERAEAAGARDAAARARDLAQALDSARSSAAELNMELRREHERKDEFLAMLAHELRNPLSPLANSIEILRRSAPPEDTLTARQLEVMARQVHQLTRVVDDLLDVARVSRGLIDLRRERLALEDVIDDAIEAVRPLVEARSHTLLRLTERTAVQVSGDRVRLTQVLVNLLTNAAKYTQEGGRITLSVVLDHHRVSVVIQDSGIGIPQDMLSRVFDMFIQVPSSLVRSEGGLGIGLTLARRLVELHGGRISAYSRGEGQGSTFTVSLPQVGFVTAAAAPAPEPQPRETSAPNADGPRVLVVDDNRDAAETLSALLECMGAQARIAHNGEQALQLAASYEPHLVLLDIGLPGMDGHEIARRLRAASGLRAHLVALTGYGTPEDRERALQAGFDEHVVKPLPAGKIERLLQQLTESQMRCR